MAGQGRGRPTKNFQDYLVESSETHISHSDYIESPATAFLKYCNHASNAVTSCKTNFKKTNEGELNVKAHASLQRIVTAMLPSIMGHFETFQRYFFANIFEHSTYLANFDAKKFFDGMKKAGGAVAIDPIRLSAYRELSAPVGLMLTDNLSGWHDPERVNSYFRCFDFNTAFFTNDDVKNLKVLWQLRHSIVHTGGSITIPDSKKVSGLENFAEQRIVFKNDFIKEVARKMHPLVRDATGRVEAEFRRMQDDNLPTDIEQRLNKLFEIKGRNSWLN